MQQSGGQHALQTRAQTGTASDHAGGGDAKRDLIEEVEAGRHQDRCTYTHLYLKEE